MGCFYKKDMSKLITHVARNQNVWEVCGDDEDDIDYSNNLYFLNKVLIDDIKFLLHNSWK